MALNDEIEKKKKDNLNINKDLRDFIFDRSFHYQVPDKDSKSKTWNNLINQFKNKKEQLPKEKYKELIPKRYYNVAAVLIALVVFSFTGYQLSIERITVNSAEHASVTLPDESVVYLNAESELAYSKLFWNTHRKVRLSGEAYFDVHKGSVFEVKSESGTVRVLGTLFNIFDRNGCYIVNCYSGKVKVVSGKDYILKEGNKIDFMVSPEIQFFDDDLNEDWRSGEFHFQNKPLDFVFAEIGRQFDVSIILSEKNSHKYYTGYFTCDNLSTALEMVCVPMQISYTLDGVSIHIEE